ncbi:hypothetical protein WJX72_007957 [[Myrmecia] bisecta]|uniref:Nuclear pore complex protein Nup85 n=1 Tax=[Myrmecia] bisecta TaxID=41462 RepID=A0AAW1P4I4_9CHLO
MEADAALVTAVPCQPGSRLHVAWGRGSELLLADVSTGPPGQPVTSSLITWGFPSGMRRRLVYDSLPLYKALHTKQLQAQQRGQALPADTVAEYVRTIGAIVATDDARQASVENEEADSEAGELLQESALWDLLRIFFAEAPNNHGLVTEELMQWAHRHNSVLSGSVSLAASLATLLDQISSSASTPPEQLPGYWSTLHRLVANGWLEQAMELLGLHSVWTQAYAARQDPNTTAVLQVLESAGTELLRRMPRFRPAGQEGLGQSFQSLPDFERQRQAWKRVCQTILSQEQHIWSACAAASPKTAAGLRQLVAILGGDEDSVRHSVRGWLELLVGQLLHVYPLLKPQADLSVLVDRSIQQAGPPATPFGQMLAQVLKAAADVDIQGLVQLSSRMCSAWFMAHVGDLLLLHPAAKAVLKRPLPHNGGDQLEFFTLEYASSLAPYPATWHLAAEYLAWCPSHGAGAMETLIARLPLTLADERLALRLLRLCQLYSIPGGVGSVCRAMGVIFMQAGRLAAALAWLMRSDDEGLLREAVQPLLDAITLSLADLESQDKDGVMGELSDLEGLLGTLSTLGPDQDSSARLDALRRQQGVMPLLRNLLVLHQSMDALYGGQPTSTDAQQQAQQSAGAAVLGIMRNSAASPQLRLQVLFHIIPLLERAPPSFLHEEVQELLLRVQDIDSPHTKYRMAPNRKAQLVDGTCTTTLQFNTAADLLKKLAKKGWNPQQGATLLNTANNTEVVDEDDVPEETDITVELQRAALGPHTAPHVPQQYKILCRLGNKQRTCLQNGSVNVEALQAFLVHTFPQLAAADYSISEGDRDVLSTPGLSQGFLRLLQGGGLDYLNLPGTYVIRQVPSHFKPVAFGSEDYVGSCRAPFSEVLEHYTRDLVWRHDALSSLERQSTGQTRKEVMSPLFVMAIKLLGGDMKLAAELGLSGSLGNGRIDYAVLGEKLKILLAEAKTNNWEEAEGRAFAMTAAAREEFVRSSIAGTKRKREEIDELLPVPSTMLLCNGMRYCFYRYAPKEGKRGMLTRSKELHVNLKQGVTVEDIRGEVKELVEMLVGVLKFQKEEFQKAVGDKRLKLLDE